MPFAAIISRSRTTTGWLKGGEKSPPLPFQLGGIQRGGEIGIFPPLACFLFLSIFSLHEQRENGPLPGRYAAKRKDPLSIRKSGPRVQGRHAKRAVFNKRYSLPSTEQREELEEGRRALLVYNKNTKKKSSEWMTSFLCWH